MKLSMERVYQSGEFLVWVHGEGMDLGMLVVSLVEEKPVKLERGGRDLCGRRLRDWKLQLLA